MTKIGLYVVAALIAATAVGFPWWWAHHLHGELTTARADLANAQAATNNCASALQQANEATAQAEAKAELMRSQAQALIDGIKSQKGKNDAAGAAFAQKVTASAKAHDCQTVLEATLCPALSGY